MSLEKKTNVDCLYCFKTHLTFVEKNFYKIDEIVPMTNLNHIQLIWLLDYNGDNHILNIMEIKKHFYTRKQLLNKKLKKIK